MEKKSRKTSQFYHLWKIGKLAGFKPPTWKKSSITGKRELTTASIKRFEKQLAEQYQSPHTLSLAFDAFRQTIPADELSIATAKWTALSASKKRKFIKQCVHPIRSVLISNFIKNIPVKKKVRFSKKIRKQT